MKIQVPTWLKSHWQQLSQEDFSHLPHALIFSGPTGMGKRHLAQLLATTLLCDQVKQNSGQAALFAQKDDSVTRLPCHQCRTCAWVKASTHPDFCLLEPQGSSGVLGIDLIRELIVKLQKTAHQGGWKIVVIDKAESLSVAAMNSLLKTLEEPLPNTLIILLVNGLSKLPATVHSRCQVLDFQADESHFESFAQEMANMDDKQVEIAYRLAEGSPILSQLFLEIGVVEKYLKWVDEWQAFCHGKVASFTLWRNWADYKIDGSDWCKESAYHQMPIVFEYPVLAWMSNYLKRYLVSASCLNQMESYRGWFDLYQQMKRRQYWMNSSVNGRLLISDLITQWDQLAAQRPLI